MTLEQELSIVKDTGKPKFAYDFDPKDVVLDQPLIYKWTITDDAGMTVGVYVGKAKGGEDRARTQYGRNVNNLLTGKPYRKGKETAFRKVHVALAEAVKQGHNIKLEFVCNVATDEDINQVEQEQILAADSRGPSDWQLNG
jgi:hypothetical protein